MYILLYPVLHLLSVLVMGIGTQLKEVLYTFEVIEQTSC